MALVMIFTASLPVVAQSGKTKLEEKLVRQDIFARRAHSLLDAGKAKEGLENLLAACAQPMSKSADTQKLLIADLERVDKPQEAEKVVEAVKKLAPSSANWMVWKGFLNKEQGNFKEATEWYLKAADQKFWPDPHIIAYSAQDLHQMGRSKEALIVLDKFEARERPLWFTNYFRGMALYDLKQLEESRKFFRLALKQYPGGVEAISYLSRVDSLLKDYPAVLKDTDCVFNIKKYPQHLVKIYGDRGDACQALALHKQAVEEYSRAIKISESSVLFKKRAESYKKLGQAGPASQDLKTAGNIDETIKPLK